VRNPGIQFKVWAMMIGTAVIACLLALEMYLFDFATRQYVFTVGRERWSEILMLWIVMNLPIVAVPLLLAFAYFHNRECDDVDRHVDGEDDG
jgi:hypothetical protein